MLTGGQASLCNPAASGAVIDDTEAPPWIVRTFVSGCCGCFLFCSRYVDCSSAAWTRVLLRVGWLNI